MPHGPSCGLLFFFHPSSLSPQVISSSPLTLNATHLPVIPDFIPIEQTYSMPPLQYLKESSNLTRKLKFLIFSPVPQICVTTVHPPPRRVNLPIQFLGPKYLVSPLTTQPPDVQSASKLGCFCLQILSRVRWPITTHRAIP